MRIRAGQNRNDEATYIYYIERIIQKERICK